MTDGSRLGHFAELLSGTRLGQFLSVGAFGYVVDNLVLAALVELAGASVVWGKPISAETAIVVMFVANERWTFAEWGRAGGPALSRRFLKSNVVRWGGAGVAYVVLLLLTEFYGIHYLVANTIGIGFGFVVNYTAESLFTWRVGADAG